MLKLALLSAIYSAVNDASLIELAPLDLSATCWQLTLVTLPIFAFLSYQLPTRQLTLVISY